MAAPRERLVALDRPEPLAQKVSRVGSSFTQVHWNHLVLEEQRQVIGTLVLSRVQPAAASNRERHSVDTQQLNLVRK